MNLNSLRLKIALFSGLFTGLLLVGLGVVLWRATYQFNLDRLDREIRNLGRGNLERVLGGDHWIRLNDALKFVSGDQPSATYILWVKNYDRVVYQSPDWPGDLVAESFQEITEYEGPGGPGPGRPPPPPPRRGEEISPRNPGLPLKEAKFFTCSAGGRNWRVGVMGNPYVTLIIGADFGEFNRRMVSLRNRFLAALPLALLLVAGGAWLVASRALRPVTALTRIAEQVTARGLDQRIPAMSRDQEFNRLITVFNEMLDRLEKSFQQATRFSADASHELKTPLARLQLELEQALQHAPAGSPEQEAYSSLLDEVTRLKAIVQKLLLLSLADAGQLRLNCVPVNLSQVLENIIEDCQAQAPLLALEQDLAPGVMVSADPDLLEQALQNLANNAVKYNRAQGRIRFELKRQGDCVRVSVTNSGATIPPEDRDRIFERFYRTDKSRSGRVEGVGLGLSLAREIIRAHGGELRLEKSEADGTTFVAELRQ